MKETIFIISKVQIKYDSKEHRKEAIQYAESLASNTSMGSFHCDVKFIKSSLIKWLQPFKYYSYPV